MGEMVDEGVNEMLYAFFFAISSLDCSARASVVTIILKLQTLIRVLFISTPHYSLIKRKVNNVSCSIL